MAKKATVGDTPEGEAPVLRRSLTRLDLTVIGVAQIIGAGIVRNVKGRRGGRKV